MEVASVSKNEKFYFLKKTRHMCLPWILITALNGYDFQRKKKHLKLIKKNKYMLKCHRSFALRTSLTWFSQT